MIVTYVTDSSILPDPLSYPQGLDMIASDRAEKIHRIRHQQTRKQSFGAGLLLCYVMHRQSGVPYQEKIRPAFSCGRYGKPVSPQLIFNLSHAGNYVMISTWAKEKEVLADNLSIGCDIEQVKSYNPKIARRFFAAAEYRCLEAADRKYQAEQFCRYWTRKESVMKLTGLGMALPMDMFDISRKFQIIPDREKIAAWQASQAGKQTECIHAAKLLLNGKIFFQEYSYDNCCITVCSTIDRFAAGISIVPAEELLEIAAIV